MRAKKILLILIILSTAGFAQLKQELRAVWLTNVASSAMFSDKGITDAMNLLASRGFNVVFPVVWNNGYTLYPSAIMNSNFSIPIAPSFSGKDPLKKIILEAHRNGMEVIPWFEYGFASSYSNNGGHIIAKYPAWAAKNNAGTLLTEGGFDWMAATSPAVQNFISSIVLEVVDNYDVDGVQGDDRLPGMPIAGSYDDSTKAIYRLENAGSDPPANYQDINWKKWRANKLNQFFKRLRDSVKTRGSQFIISAAPNPYPYGYDNYLQDAKTWVDSGLVDNYIPQLYRRDYASYTGVVNSALYYVPTAKMGITFSGMLARVDTFVISPSYLLNGIAYNRSKGMMGESYFFYEAFPMNGNKLADTLRATVYKQDAIPPYRNGNIWRPKATVVNEDNPVLVKKYGDWQPESIQAFDTTILWVNSPNPASLEYSAKFDYSAWFDVYTYIVPYFSFTKYARYTLYSGSDSSVVVVNQQDSKNIGWVYLGTVYASQGTRKFMKLDNSMAESGKYVLADAGMLMINRKKSPGVVISSVQDNLTNPGRASSFELFQNYPNPFNPSTEISYRVPEGGGHITLRVYDLLGRLVSEPVNAGQQPGIHTVQFSGSGLSSGLYFYSLSTPSRTVTKKMMLVR